MSIPKINIVKKSEMKEQKSINFANRNEKICNVSISAKSWILIDSKTGNILSGKHYQ